MRILYIDVLSGAAGDMLLSACIDLGFPVLLLEEQLKKLHIEHIDLHVEKTVRNGVTGTKMTPHLGHAHEHRHLHDILDILKNGLVPQEIYARCEKVLDHLAEAEAKVHGIPKDHVHFHEIGALDTIVDILGFCMALDYFKVDKLIFSTLTDGHGTIKAAHGVMPVPVPATAVMIEGYAFKTLPVATELLTPTGVALLTALGEQSVAGCAGIVKGMGYGCGSKVFSDHPNFIRATLFECEVTSTPPISDTVYMLETDMDHISGEIMGDVAKRLLEAGAFDVCWLPVYMKKGRPGYRLSVLSGHINPSVLIDLIIRHTRTLGVRVQEVRRVTTERSHTRTMLADMECHEKHCTYKGYTFSKPEFESLAEISRKKGCSVIDLMEEYVRERR